MARMRRRGPLEPPGADPGFDQIRHGPGTPMHDGKDPRVVPDATSGNHVRWKDLPEDERNRRSVERKVLWIWRQHGKLPTVQRLAAYAHMDEEVVARALADPVTIANLRADGAIPPDADDWEAATGQRVALSGQQLDAIRRIFERVDPDDAATWRQALAEVGVSVREWNGWMRDPLFAAFVRDAGARLFGDHAHAVDIALLRNAVAGDTAAIKLVLEVTGRIKQNRDQVDANMLLARVVEVLRRHLPVGLLEPIIDDLENLAGVLAHNTVAAPKIIEAAPVPAELVDS